MSSHKKYLWVTIEAETSDGLREKCKKLYPGYIIVKGSIIKSQYNKELKYKQLFVLREVIIKPSK